MFEAIFLQRTMWRLKRLSMCGFNHMVFLMTHVTCLNNIHRWYLSYKPPHSNVEEIGPKWFIDSHLVYNGTKMTKHASSS